MVRSFFGAFACAVVAMAFAAPYYGAEYVRRTVEFLRWVVPAEVHLGAANGKLATGEKQAVWAQKQADACTVEEGELRRQLTSVRQTKTELGEGLALRKDALAAAATLAPEALATAKAEFGQWLNAYNDAVATEEKLLARLAAVEMRHAKLEALARDVIERVDEARSRLAQTTVDVMVGKSDELLAATNATLDEVGSLARAPREFEAVLAQLRAPMARTLSDMSVAELTAQAEEALAK